MARRKRLTIEAAEVLRENGGYWQGVGADTETVWGGGEMTGLMAVMMWQERVVIVEWQRGLLGWLLIGLIAGWLAGKLSRGQGFGCIGDIVLGLIGSVIGGWIFSKLGIVHANTFLFSLAAATVGAVVLVSIAHLFFGGPKRG